MFSGYLIAAVAVVWAVIMLYVRWMWRIESAALAQGYGDNHKAAADPTPES